MNNIFNNFNLENYSQSSPKEIIRDIILLDQFSRNINRIVGVLDIIEYTNKAIQLSNQWIKKNITCHVLSNGLYLLFFQLDMVKIRIKLMS